MKNRKMRRKEKRYREKEREIVYTRNELNYLIV